MKFLRKILGLKPIKGDTVVGALDPMIGYSGIILETDYKNPYIPGAWVSGAITVHTDWNGIITKEDPRFFVPISRLHIA